MDQLFVNEYCEMLDYLMGQNMNPEVRSIMQQDLMAVFRADMMRYMLYLADGEITDMQADYINNLCGTYLTRERLTTLKKKEDGLPQHVPFILHLLVQIDNTFPVNYEDNGKKNGNRYALYASWGMVRLYTMVGSRFHTFGTLDEDSPEKIRKRKDFLQKIGDYVDGAIINAKYDRAVKYVPAVAETPFRGSVGERYFLTSIIENDNPYMPSTITQFNFSVKDGINAQELLRTLLMRALSGKPSPADMYAIAGLLRAGAKIDPSWPMPSERRNNSRQENMSGVEENLLDIPKIQESSIEAHWADYDDMISGMQDDGEEDGRHHTIIMSNGPMTPETLGKVIGRAIGLENADDADKENAGEQDSYDSKTLDELKAELKNLIGLNKVKLDIESTMNIMRINQKRKEAGLKPNAMTMHMVFMGNPGTGKTTVARLIAAIYKKMGILSKGQFVETDCEGLIAEYVGQTAVKTKKIVEKAMGGVLFIDEAYMLNGRGNDSFGEEAIATLIKLMEDKRDDLVVIFAGYTDLINEFLDKNPGIRSRINKYITFDNYSGQELYDIFDLMCRDSDYMPDESCREYTKQFFTARASRQIRDYSNGRDVRNYLEKAITNQADRLAKTEKLSKKALKTLTLDDVTGIEMDGDRKEKAPMGFHAVGAK